MIQHKLKIGDEVIVLEPIDRDAYGPGWTEDMENGIGKKATVFQVSNNTNDRYRLQFDGEKLRYWWDISNLQPFNELLY